MSQQVIQVKRDMEWHNAIAKHLPQVNTQPHGDPRSIIEWLFERVTIKDSAMHIANTLKESEVEVTPLQVIRG